MSDFLTLPADTMEESDDEIEADYTRFNDDERPIPDLDPEQEKDYRIVPPSENELHPETVHFPTTHTRIGERAEDADVIAVRAWLTARPRFAALTPMVATTGETSETLAVCM